MEPRLINPFLHAAPSPGVAAVPRPGKREPVYARLPDAPVTGSPVPELTSLYHNPDPGPWGDRRYPGNCSGNLIRDLLRFYRPGTVYDPMSGGGTCRDVCRDLGVYCHSGDIHAGFDACEPHFTDAFGFCWIHPPYYRQKLYADDPRDLSREPTLDGFLKRYEQLVRACAQAVVPGGQVAVLMGDYTDREYGFIPLVFYTKLLAFRAGLRQCATDIIRFSHGATSGRKAYRSAFIPGLHDTCCVFEKPAGRGGRMTDDLLSDWFHQAALAVGFVAAAEGWLADTGRVQRAVYALFEAGVWPEDPPPAPAGVTTPPKPAKRFTHPNRTETL